MEINEAGKSEDELLLRPPSAKRIFPHRSVMGVHGKHSILDYCEVSSLDRHAGRCAHQALTPNTTSRLYYACLGLN